MTDGLSRREFLRTGTAAAVASSIMTGRPSRQPRGAEGSKSEAEVPDTLDLADRAGLAVNALTGAADPKFLWETALTTHLDHRPPYMNWHMGGPCLQKPVHALPMMRIMSGSTLNADVDLKMMEAITRDIDSEGLWWLKLEGRPWRVGLLNEDVVWLAAQGRLMVALLDWYKYDGDPRWLKLVERMAGGLSKIALRHEDRAWYYVKYSRAGWRQRSGNSMVYYPPGNTTEEPARPPIQEIGLPLRGLARWIEISGDKESLDLARRLANFMLKPSMWGTSEGPTMAVAAQRALWEGHFHSYTMGMMGLLDYAIATNDYGLKEFVANFYEHGRNFGIPRIGFFPAVIGPLKKIQEGAAQYGGTGAKGQCDDGCDVADMTWLAARLSEAGVGDYWDDVDQYVRNALVEHQLLRRDLLEEMIAGGPEHKIDPSMQTDKDVIERNMGCFIGGGDPTILYGWWTMCCNANMPTSLYKAWESIVRHNNGVVQVNLLLNRASAWLDVDSYLPYEGKVVLKNKTARKAYVRIPLWADKKAVRCRINQKNVAPYWLNQYLVVEGLSPRDVVSIEFPVVEKEEKYTEASYEVQYTCRLRGNTLVDISPRAESPQYTQMGSDDGVRFPVRTGYPLYQRDFYRGDKAPIKKVSRHVSRTLI